MTLGIDEAVYQHPGGKAIDWHAVKAAGYDIAYIKATEADRYLNPYFHADAALAAAAGLRVGAYHFFRPSVGAVVQAQFFLEQIDGAPTVEPPAGDFEAADGLDWNRVANGAHLFVSTVRDAKGACVVYYNLSWREGLAPYGAPWGQPEWVARPGGPDPGTEGWQKGQGAVPGISGAVDIDVFHDQVSGVSAGDGEGAAAAPEHSQRGSQIMLTKADGTLAIAVVPRSPEYGGGEWVIFQDGGVHATGGAPYYGSYPGLNAAWPQQGVGVFTDAKARAGVDGYTLCRQDGALYRFGSDTIADYKAGGGK